MSQHPQQLPPGAPAATQVPAGYVAGYVDQKALLAQRIGPLADPLDRVVARLWDTLHAMLRFLPLYLVGGILLVVGASMSGEADGSTTGTILMVLGALLMGAAVVCLVAFLIWNSFLRAGRTGQTLGRQKVGIAVVGTETGRPIGAGQMFVRLFLNSLANNVMYLGWLWMLWDERGQTLGEKATSCHVVKVTRPVDPANPTPPGLLR